MFLTLDSLAPAVSPHQSPKKRILILSVSAGSGHVRAAEAIRAHACTRDDVEALHIDVMDHVPAGFRKVYTDFYIALVNRHPVVWGYLYQVTNEARPDSMMQRLRRAAERLNTRRLAAQIDSFRPDVIVCTHFLPAEILSRMIRTGRLACPVWVQVTDFDLHRMWVHENMTGYFAANEEVAFRMRASGIAGESIRVTGIPIMPAFGSAPGRSECARDIGVDPALPTVLLMGGGAGLGGLERLAARLLALEGGAQLIAMAGRNHAALASLQALAAMHPGRLVAQGFTERVERLMACSDIAITKPGGLSTSECLAMRLPMVLNSPIPGQEERNADFLLEEGAALKASDAVTLEYRVRHLLQHPGKLACMRENAVRLARPDAARDVLNSILSHTSCRTACP